MRSYLIRRVLLMIPVILGVSIIIFSLISFAPGDPFAQMIELNSNMSQEDYENLLDSIGYYDPIPVRYLKWAKQVATGNLGYSISQKQPIDDMIGRRLQNTLLLSIPALVLSTIISIPLGVFSATRQYSWGDYILTILALVGISIPAFFLALLMIKYLAFDWKLFPMQGMETIAARFTGLAWFLDRLHHIALPLAVMTLIQVAGRMRYTRSSMLEIINQDYIRTARAKGMSERSVIYKHALRNALIPVITVLSISLGALLSGAILTENVFMWPGMGTLVYQAISNRDYPLVMAGTMVLALSMLAANLFADIAYAFADPRIRYD